MNRDEVRELEEVCEAALSNALRTQFDKALPMQVYHLMAKAAVTVLETHLVSERPPRGPRQ